MTRLSLIITCLVFAAGASAQPPKPATGAAALEGSWVVASINGQTAPEGSPAMTLTFTGDKYEQALGAEVNERGSFKVDATKKPMTIDLSITEGSDAGSTQLGVFEVTGDDEGRRLPGRREEEGVIGWPATAAPPAARDPALRRATLDARRCRRRLTTS